jgi:hypothetical protein
MDAIKELREALGPECDWLTGEGIIRQACGEIEAHRKYMHALRPFANPHLPLDDDLLRIVGLLKSNAPAHAGAVATSVQPDVGETIQEDRR